MKIDKAATCVAISCMKRERFIVPIRQPEMKDKEISSRLVNARDLIKAASSTPCSVAETQLPQFPCTELRQLSHLDVRFRLPLDASVLPL